jgi:hypothetical protein
LTFSVSNAFSFCSTYLSCLFYSFHLLILM